MADAIFADRRLAAIYDPLDPDRSDLTPYADIIEQLGAASVLDIGCGTGTFACLLAARGIAVVGVDPAGASLEVARGKAHADKVRWIQGVATDLPQLQVDAAVMTGNVAQVFVADEDWAATLQAVHDALHPGGVLVLETRDPAARAWLDWNPERSHRVVHVDGVGLVETWVELLEVTGELVTFRHTWIFESDGATLTSDSTLRFRTGAEISSTLTRAGFVVEEIRDAPDRPGKEMVFVART